MTLIEKEGLLREWDEALDTMERENLTGLFSYQMAKEMRTQLAIAPAVCCEECEKRPFEPRFDVLTCQTCYCASNFTRRERPHDADDD